jgi:hypothetical protein
LFPSIIKVSNVRIQPTLRRRSTREEQRIDIRQAAAAIHDDAAEQRLENDICIYTTLLALIPRYSAAHDTYNEE